MQFSVAVDDFLRFCHVERQLSPHTLQAYGCDLADFAKWLPRGAALAEVTTATFKAYLEDMVGTRKLAVATVRRRFACLRAFFRRQAPLAGTADPFADWRLKLPRRRRLPRTLTHGEVSTLLTPLRGAGGRGAGLAAHELGTAVRLMISTGLRVGELCRIRIEDLSPDGASVRVHGKGSRDRVAYVADADLRRDLQGMADDRRRRGRAAGPLFVNRDGAPLMPQSIRARLRRLAADAGIARRVTPHMLRHTAATLLIETGVDIRFVQRLLGHSSIATTEIYTHVSDEALRTTLERANVLGVVGGAGPCWGLPRHTGITRRWTKKLEAE